MAHAPWLLNVPQTQDDWNVWAFHHRLSHTAIRQAIQTKLNIPTTEYVLDPMVQDDIKGWLQRNSQTHIQQTAAVGLQSHDIQDVDFNDQSQKLSWIEVHWQEHQDMELALGV